MHWSKERFDRCPRGVVLAATAPFWPFLKIAFGALVTIYFKIEKNFRKQKSSALMRSIWSMPSDLSYNLKFGLQSPKTVFY